MKLWTTLTALTVVGLALGSPLTANAATTVLHAKVSGSSVVPGPGDQNAKGTFKGKIKDDQFCYQLHVKKIVGITSVGIFEGVEGTNGDLVITLDQTTRGARGCTTIVPDDEDTESTLSESEAAALAANPEGYHVQLATVAFPDGAVRGQLK